MNEKIDSLKQQLEAAQSEDERAHVLLLLSHEYYGCKPDEALQIARQALAISRDEHIKAQALYCMGNYYYALSQLGEAISCFHQASAIFRRRKDELWKAKVQNSLAFIYHSRGEYQKAFELSIQNLTVFEQYADKVLMGSAWDLIGAIHVEWGNYPEAVRAFLHQLALREQTGGAPLAQCYRRLGEVYEQIKDYARAVDYYYKSLDVTRMLRNPRAEARSLLAIGTLYCDHENPDRDIKKGLASVRKAQKLFTRLNSSQGICACLLRIGDVYFHTEKFASAAKVFRQILSIAAATGNGRFRTITQAYLGSIALRRGQYGRAVNLLEDSLSLAQANNDPITQYQICNDLSEAYEKKGNMAKALECHRAFFILKQQIMNREQQRRISAYETHLAQEKLEKEKEIYRLKSEHLAREAEAVSRNLEISVLQLMKKNRLLEHISRQVAQILHSRTPSLSGLRSILQEARAAGTQEVPAVEYQQQEIQAFLSGLALCFPSLTPAELRMCTFIRANISSEKIAALLSLSERTVDAHRYSIRKKMAVASTVSLQTFLSSIASADVY